MRLAAPARLNEREFHASDGSDGSTSGGDEKRGLKVNRRDTASKDCLDLPVSKALGGDASSEHEESDLHGRPPWLGQAVDFGPSAQQAVFHESDRHEAKNIQKDQADSHTLVF